MSCAFLLLLFFPFVCLLIGVILSIRLDQSHVICVRSYGSMLYTVDFKNRQKSKDTNSHWNSKFSTLYKIEMTNKKQHFVLYRSSFFNIILAAIKTDHNNKFMRFYETLNRNRHLKSFFAGVSWFYYFSALWLSVYTVYRVEITVIGQEKNVKNVSWGCRNIKSVGRYFDTSASIMGRRRFFLCVSQYLNKMRQTVPEI